MIEQNTKTLLNIIKMFLDFINKLRLKSESNQIRLKRHSNLDDSIRSWLGKVDSIQAYTMYSNLSQRWVQTRSLNELKILDRVALAINAKLLFWELLLWPANQDVNQVIQHENLKPTNCLTSYGMPAKLGVCHRWEAAKDWASATSGRRKRRWRRTLVYSNGSLNGNAS